MRTQLLHPIHVSGVLIRTHSFSLWALLTSCYRSITRFSGENYFTVTMLGVIVKHQCLFRLKRRMCSPNASFQTECAPPGEISTRQLPVAAQEKVLSSSQVFSL